MYVSSYFHALQSESSNFPLNGQPQMGFQKYECYRFGISFSSSHFSFLHSHFYKPIHSASLADITSNMTQSFNPQLSDKFGKQNTSETVALSCT